MKKNEYVDKLVNLIINKITYHAPCVKDSNIDYALLDAVGIDVKYPIFVFSKPLSKIYYKAFKIAKEQVDFNLVLFAKPRVSTRKIKALSKTYIFIKDEIGSNLLYALDALNINYIAHSDYQFKDIGEYLKINDKEIKLEYRPYFTNKIIKDSGAIFNITNFILNGKNYSLNITNTTKNCLKVKCEINIPLPRGYYSFKKGHRCVEIENLTSYQKAYFNFSFKNANISFSNLSGIESCTYACVNCRVEIDLLPLEKKCLFFNYGESKYILSSPKDIQYFFELSQIKMNKIFDLQVSSHDKQFDQLFNYSLPRNIWEKWQNFDVDEKSENEWLKLKKEIVSFTPNGIKINEDYKALKEVRFYRNNGWKRVFIVHNNACYLFDGKVKYFNYTLLTNEIFNKNNEIYLSFAN